ncbi:MAG TPA: AmmeMemoRadiSam system radical SAM enzyme, partial [Candidatus Peregrinibacteria bacterium]|nr:AmmeMemoRadiSam system radical SAM enzyme [Candidatus Peregrinibacteria bacterium]
MNMEEEYKGKEATLFKKLEGKKVQCLACAHYCQIPEGKTGICGVRKNYQGKLYLIVYGRAIAVNTDPVEKKPLYHFLPKSLVYSIGTIGCNFRCQFCQNWDISQYMREKGAGAEILGQDLSPEKIIDHCKRNKIPAVSFTYNEPAIFFEYARDTARLAHENKMKTIYVSNGYESKEALEEIAPYLDAINVDIKSFSEEFYNKICGAKLQPVLDTVKRVKEKGIWMEITTL